jgi:hypothetical protein
MTDGTARTLVATEILLIALGILGLAGTWAQVFDYLSLGLLPGNVQFWKETVATPASTFITVDVLVLAAALFVWMFGEGRRLGIGVGWLWGYFFASLLVAISFALPLFLAHRHRYVRLHRPGEIGAPAGADWIAISVAVLIALAAAGFSLRHVP